MFSSLSPSAPRAGLASQLLSYFIFFTVFLSLTQAERVLGGPGHLHREREIIHAERVLEAHQETRHASHEHRLGRFQRRELEDDAVLYRRAIVMDGQIFEILERRSQMKCYFKKIGEKLKQVCEKIGF